MEESARRYARNILLIHLVLLCVVILLVFLAGREIYVSTRAQVMDQSMNRQALLANQTARGVESFYDSILSDLDLLQRSENDDSPTPARHGPKPARQHPDRHHHLPRPART